LGHAILAARNEKSAEEDFINPTAEANSPIDLDHRHALGESFS
jgi:hypothetical protein